MRIGMIQSGNNGGGGRRGESCDASLTVFKFNRFSVDWVLGSETSVRV